VKEALKGYRPVTRFSMAIRHGKVEGKGKDKAAPVLK
jgi:hypothetical protein